MLRSHAVSFKPRERERDYKGTNLVNLTRTVSFVATVTVHFDFAALDIIALTGTRSNCTYDKTAQ